MSEANDLKNWRTSTEQRIAALEKRLAEQDELIYRLTSRLQQATGADLSEAYAGTGE